MSEQPLQTSNLAPVSPDEYTWHDVAREAAGWHPGLQPYAEDQLASRGLAVVVNHQPQPETSTKISSLSAAESAHTSKEIDAAFSESLTSIYKITSDPKFADRCVQMGIDPYDDMNTAAYWKTFADFTNDRIASLRSRAGDNLKLQAIELLAATPDYLFAEDILHDSKARQAKDERYECRAAASKYNGLIRNFALTHPETSVSSLKANLLSVVNIAVEDIGMKQNADSQLKKTMTGAQHEIAFGQILESTHIPYQAATMEQDLRGIDYVVYAQSSKPVYIDVKASLRAIRDAGGEATPYVIALDDHVTMYSLVKPEELNDRFTITQTQADIKAEKLTPLLKQIRSHVA